MQSSQSNNNKKSIDDEAGVLCCCRRVVSLLRSRPNYEASARRTVSLGDPRVATCVLSVCFVHLGQDSTSVFSAVVHAVVPSALFCLFVCFARAPAPRYYAVCRCSTAPADSVFFLLRGGPRLQGGVRASDRVRSSSSSLRCSRVEIKKSKRPYRSVPVRASVVAAVVPVGTNVVVSLLFVTSHDDDGITLRNGGDAPFCRRILVVDVAVVVVVAAKGHRRRLSAGHYCVVWRRIVSFLRRRRSRRRRRNLVVVVSFRPSSRRRYYVTRGLLCLQYCGAPSRVVPVLISSVRYSTSRPLSTILKSPASFRYSTSRDEFEKTSGNSAGRYTVRYCVPCQEEGGRKTRTHNGGDGRLNNGD